MFQQHKSKQVYLKVQIFISEPLSKIGLAELKKFVYFFTLLVILQFRMFLTVLMH